VTGAVILVVDDEVQVRRFLRATLTSHGFQCLEAATAEDGLRELAQRQPDVVLLDLGLPDLDGIEFTRRVRSWSKVPILVLSARGQEKDKIAALESGADDYLTKPFGVGELVARIKVALRHVAGNAAPGEPVFASGDLRVDLGRREVSVGGKAVHLTPIEFRLLTILIQHAGKVVMQKQLLAEVWGPAATGETHYLRVHMSNLRGKLEADPAQPVHIVTEPGVGYRLMD
jgi:two-component system KDP operon response regulator KdpE